MVRFKNRYLVCEYHSEDAEKELTQFELKNQIKESVHLHFGDLGLGKVSFSMQIKYLNTLTKVFILRIARDQANMVWNSLTFMTEVDQRPFQVRVLGCSGTIKKCEIRVRRLLSKWVHRMLKQDLPPKIREILIRDYKQAQQMLPELTQ